MSCELINDLMMKHFDGEINDIEEAQLKQHMKTCRKCNEEFNCMSEVFLSLETTSTVAPPEDFEARVMEKVNALENTRKEKSSKMLVLFYNLGTAISILLLMIFVADLKHVSIGSIMDQVTTYFGSFSSIANAVLGIFADLYHLIAGVLGVILAACVSVAKTYYYVFVVLLALLLAIQKLITLVAVQDRRES